MELTRKIVYIFVLSCLHRLTAGKREVAEEKVRKQLLTIRSYEPGSLPTFDVNTAVEVKFGIALQQIMNVDVHNEKFSALVWLNYEWMDPRLTWNLSDYNGVQSVRMKTSEIWMPDIHMYNSISHESVMDERVVVYNDGTCSLVPICRTESSCTYDLTWFPFDTQICTLKYGSWTYHGSKVNLTAMNREVDTSTYQPSKGWDLIRATANRHVQKYACCPEPYIDITFELEIKRRGSKYGWEYVSPAMVLAFLIPVLFILPSESSARFALGSGMLVSILLLMTLLSNIIPRELIARPMLGRFYDMLFGLVSLAMAISAVICRVSSPGSVSPPPNILKVILINGLGRVLCVTYDHKFGSATVTETDLDRIVRSDEQTSFARAADYEWRLIAKVLDRFFALVFLIFIILGSLIIVPK